MARKSSSSSRQGLRPNRPRRCAPGKYLPLSGQFKPRFIPVRAIFNSTFKKNEMKKKYFLPMLAMAFAALFATGCNSAAPVREEVKEDAAPAKSAITNPNFEIAPIEYAGLSEKAIGYFAKFDYDAWADMLADNVVYAFPDGDVNTRTKLEGKPAVLAWWKAWKEKSGIQSMTLGEFNHTPINTILQPKGGALMGIAVISYFSNRMVMAGKTIDLRMNFSVHFNAEKKIDRYTTYYDRSVIIKGSGKNMLEELKAKK
jgi:ketosteroid isomerase-like protein